MKKEVKFLTKNLIAHRGVHDKNIPENSIEAFKIAISNKYIIELDLHILKDNKIIVFHDDNLYRMTGIRKKVKECTYEEIKELKLNNTESRIPLFKDVLNLVDGKVPILIELKTDNKVGKLEKELTKLLTGYKGEYAIQSFNPLSIFYFKNYYPNIIRGQLSCAFKEEKMNFFSRYVLKNLCFNFLTKPDFVSYDIHDISKKEVEKLREKYLMLGWTVKTKKEFEETKKYFDNIICEDVI